MGNDRENRCFRRYRKRFPARISRDNDIQHVEILDYSIEGVCVLLKKPLRCARGDLIGLESEALAINGNCEVQWISQAPEGHKLGLRKLAPISGSLDRFRLADIFIGLQKSLKSGTLRISSGTIEKNVYLKNGNIIFAGSNQPHDRLGDVLLREGRITQTAYDITSKLMSVTGKKQGTLLIEIKAMTPDDLTWAVRHQVEKILFGLFTLETGTFEFLEEDGQSGKLIQLRLPSGHLIYHGLRQPGAEAQLGDYIGLPNDTGIAFSSNPLDLFQDIPFDEEDKKILSFIDGRRNIGQIAEASGLAETTVRRSLSVLFNIGVIEEVRDSSDEGAHPFAFIVERSLPPAGLLEAIEEMYRRHAEIDYYALLGVEESAAEGELRAAFYRTAKEFHPDRHSYFDEDVTLKLHRIFSQVVKAYGVLSSPERRIAYNKSLAEARPDDSRAGKAEEKYTQGCDFYAEQRVEEAAHCFEEAIYLDHSVAKYHFFYGLALKDLSRTRDAERAMSRSCKIVPDNDECHTELGLIYLELGQRMRAKMSFIKALQCNKDNRRAKEGLRSLA